MNQHSDAITALERLFTTDIEKFIFQVVNYQGDWLPTKKYSKFNIVTYPHGDAIETFEAIKLEIPVGTLPTDRNYFIPITLRGQQGVSGTGMSPRGYWTELKQYYKDDCVAYNNILWYAKVDNRGQVPQIGSTYWEKLMEMPKQIVTGTVPPEGQNPNDYWFNRDSDNNVSMNIRETDGSYKKVFPETKASQVKFDDGTKLEDKKNIWDIKADKGTIFPVTLTAADWVEDAENGWWTQSVSNPAIVDGRKVDITFDADNIKKLSEIGASIIVRNNAGTATAYAFNNVPSVDIAAQLEIREVIE